MPYGIGFLIMNTAVVYQIPSRKIYLKPGLIAGLLGLSLSLVTLFLFVLPMLKKEVEYRLNRVFGRQPVLAEDRGVKKISFFGQIIGNPMILYPADKEFSLVIPKINVNVPVFANVDPGNEQAYKEVLAKGVAHAQDSYLPGQLGSSFIFGHSTDYPWNIGWMNAVFYLLKELEKGDEVNVFYQGKRYTYLVSETKIVSPDEVAFLYSRLSEERLILQTCWPPGTRLKRLIVICYPNL